jgi:hypothetical protein
MMRTLVAAAVAFFLSAGAGHAQVTGSLPGSGNFDNRFNWDQLYGSARSRTPEDAGREHEIERRYQDTLRTKIPDKKPSNDPWRNMRAPTASAGDRHKVE